MIVTQRFVFLHLHKSGGTFVNAFLARYFPEARLIGYHLPSTYLPEEARGLPIFGLVRNPWDYYVSWHTFQAAREQPNPLYRVVSDDRKLGFEATVRNLVDLCDDPERHAALVDTLPEQFVNQGINLTRECIRPLLGSGLGFYSFLYRRLFGDAGEVTIGRMESLRTDLLRFLAGAGVHVTDEMRAYVLESPPLNTSAHPPYRGLYSDALREHIAQRDRLVIDTFEYEF